MKRVRCGRCGAANRFNPCAGCGSMVVAPTREPQRIEEKVERDWLLSALFAAGMIGLLVLDAFVRLR